MRYFYCEKCDEMIIATKEQLQEDSFKYLFCMKHGDPVSRISLIKASVSKHKIFITCEDFSTCLKVRWNNDSLSEFHKLHISEVDKELANFIAAEVSKELPKIFNNMLKHFENKETYVD